MSKKDLKFYRTKKDSFKIGTVDTDGNIEIFVPIWQFAKKGSVSLKIDDYKSEEVVNEVEETTENVAAEIIQPVEEHADMGNKVVDVNLDNNVTSTIVEEQVIPQPAPINNVQVTQVQPNTQVSIQPVQEVQPNELEQVFDPGTEGLNELPQKETASASMKHIAFLHKINASDSITEQDVLLAVKERGYGDYPSVYSIPEELVTNLTEAFEQIRAYIIGKK